MAVIDPVIAIAGVPSRDHSVSSRLKGEKDRLVVEDHLRRRLSNCLMVFLPCLMSLWSKDGTTERWASHVRLAERLDANELALKWYALSGASAIVAR